MRRFGRARRGAALLAALIVAAAPSLGATVVAADQATFKPDPILTTVAGGQDFTISIVQSAPVATTGAQASVHFDPKVIQLKDFALGTEYTSRSAIFAFGNADRGTAGNKAAAITYANLAGLLENASGFLLPGSGSIAAGDAIFLTLTFTAVPGGGGSSNFSPGDVSMIDEAGAPIVPHVTQGKVEVTPGGAVGSGPPPSATPSQAPTEPPASPVSPTTPVGVSIAPTSLTLTAGNTARIFLIANADGEISSVTADVTFDKDKLEIVSLEPGPSWSSGVVIALSTDRSGGVDAAITEANKSGLLQQAGVFYPPGTLDLPYGQGVFASILVRAKAAGTTNVSIGNVAAIGVAGETIPVVIDTASLTKAPDRGLQLDPTLVIPLALILGIVVVGLVLARTGRIPVRVQRRWPYYASLLLGLIPVVFFVGIVATLVLNSAPVVSFPGIPALLGLQTTGEFGRDLSGFNLIPAVWGTILLTIVAVALATPIALALAVVAVDFPLGIVTRLVRPIVAVFSGIPPIVYAVSVPIFITALMIPKFAANQTFSTFQVGGPASIGANPATWPPPDVPYSAGGFPWDLTGVANSNLLGGILVGLFLIPFLTPLFVDALRDVPRAAREASLALGANRTYTLRRVVLPRALPAIAGASTLGTLKAFGDMVIVGFAVGWAAAKVPNPLFDVLERPTSLAASGAGQIISIETLDAICKPEVCAVGYSSALALLVVAAVVVLAMTYLQVRGRRRVAT